MKALITGSRGFIGRNLLCRLREHAGFEICTFDIEDSEDYLRSRLAEADIIFHLAGVNRPVAIEEFEHGNAGLTAKLCDILLALKRAPLVVFASSIQVSLDNPYGRSKLQAEKSIREFGARTGARIQIHRLKNVFGKWSRSNYNSVVATFCHNIANELPIELSDPDREIELVYIEDVIDRFLESALNADMREVPDIASVRLTLSELAGRIQAFHDWRQTLVCPEFAIRFNQQLYATYLSYVPAERRNQQLVARTDARGSLAEFIKSKQIGQIFVSRTKTGVTRGNHYHHTKAEKFLVLEGEALIRMRRIDSSEVNEYRVRGDHFQVVDIPPGNTHSIENIGVNELVTLFWSSEIFDPDRPDTFFLPVLEATDRAVVLIA